MREREGRGVLQVQCERRGQSGGVGLNPDFTWGQGRGMGQAGASRRKGWCRGLSGGRGRVVSSARSVPFTGLCQNLASRTRIVSKAPRLAVFN